MRDIGHMAEIRKKFTKRKNVGDTVVIDKRLNLNYKQRRWLPQIEFESYEQLDRAEDQQTYEVITRDNEDKSTDQKDNKIVHEVNISWQQWTTIFMLTLIVSIMSACTVLTVCYFTLFGNQKINDLTSNGLHELRVDLTDFKGNTEYAKYSTFSVGNVSTQYKLKVDGYSGVLDCHRSEIPMKSFIKGPIYQTGSTKSNMVIEHQGTTFEGSEFYQLAKPTRFSKEKHHMKTEHNDEYCSSEEGTYDFA
ncbi:TN [Mytilus coruscus]|uniref:TN n=1 Tax=Mytilus coruscus TaxID=42192 RepID=A0A6J8ANL4_MYTCO|nr:TN [Mytilus coruscus]